MHSAAVPLTLSRCLTGWHLDLPVAALCALALSAYLAGVRRVRATGGCWSRGRTAWFVVGGLGSLVVTTMSVLGSYDRVLFWALAVQDVILLTVVPIGLTLGRPVALWRAALARATPPRPPGRIGRLVRFPLVGSVVGVTLLLLVYTTGWDAARLASPGLLQATRLLLLAAGCGYLWPLLGVDAGTGDTSYPVRALVAFADGLLDAVPGLAVLGTGHLIAAGHYTAVARTWGPSPVQDQRLGGTAMIALSELVGLPALLVLAVQWVRRDALEARDVDRELDVLDAARTVVDGPAAPAGPAALTRAIVPAATQDQEAARARPWWEIDPGPLADRAQRYGWSRPDNGDPSQR